MTLWRDEVVLFRLPAIRSRFTPRDWADIRRVRVDAGKHLAFVDIARVDEPTCYGRTRRWLSCPICKRHTSVVGLDVFSGLLGCRRCVGWRCRRSTISAPHVRDEAIKRCHPT